MAFSPAYFRFVCPCLLVLGGLFAWAAARRGWGRAALAGLGCALSLGYALAKLGWLCFYLGPQLARYGAAAFVLPRPDTFSFAAGGIGAALGVALGACACRAPVRDLLNLFAPFGAGMAACLRLGERWLGTLGAGAPLPEGHWATGTLLSVTNSWGEAHWAVCVFEAAFALLCVLLALTRWRRSESRFAQSALLLCCGQIFFELLRVNAPSWRFARIDQLWCAAVLLAWCGLRCVGRRRFGPLIATALLLGLNAYLQFVLDKPELLTRFLPAPLASAFAPRPFCCAGFLLTVLGLWAAACFADTGQGVSGSV